MDIPAGMTVESMTQGDGALANESGGKIYFTFTSLNAQNVTKTTTLMTITFRYTDDFSAATLNTVLEDIYDQDYTKVDYIIVGGEIKVK